jgi:hypothetical protein
MTARRMAISPQRSAAVSMVLAAALLLYGALPAGAQQPQAAVVPDAITVGDVFHAAIRVDLPAGTSLLAPDSLALPADVEPAGRREVRMDSVNGVPRATVIFPLTAWRPGSYDMPPLAVRVVRDGAETVMSVQLPSFTVRSVLPGDTTGVEPRPAKDVFGASRLWWPILLGLLLAAAVAAALWYWWRRRTVTEPVAEPVPVPAVVPREAALAQLDALWREGLIERGELREYYIRLTETLRRYTASLDPSWSADLTTAELSARMRSAGYTEGLELVRLLGTADLVKFARARTTPDAAGADFAAARRWVEHTEPPGSAVGSEERRAA